MFFSWFLVNIKKLCALKTCVPCEIPTSEVMIVRGDILGRWLDPEDSVLWVAQVSLQHQPRGTSLPSPCEIHECKCWVDTEWAGGTMWTPPSPEPLAPNPPYLLTTWSIVCSCSLNCLRQQYIGNVKGWCEFPWKRGFIEQNRSTSQVYYRECDLVKSLGLSLLCLQNVPVNSIQ